jgi:hypothetical protein
MKYYSSKILTNDNSHKFSLSVNDMLLQANVFPISKREATEIDPSKKI